MQINRNLNLVIPVERGEPGDDGYELLYVHSAPIDYELFQRYYLVLSKTFATIGQQGLGVIGAPRIAANLLEDVARTTYRAPGVSWWEGDDGVERGLLGEIARLSNLLSPSDKGWQTVMFDVARSPQADKPPLLSKEEAGDVLNQATFFTVTWHASPRVSRINSVESAARLYAAQTTSLNCMEYARSLTTPTPLAPTGASASAAGPASSTPSSAGSEAQRAGRRGQPVTTA